MEAERRQIAAPALPSPAILRPSQAGDDRPLFKLKAVSLEGATALSRDGLAQLYAPYLGREVSQADLLKIAETITQAYRDAGYHLSRAIVPAQDLEGGRLRIQILEGAIEEVVIEGDPSDAFGLRELLDPIRSEHPSRLTTLERRLLLAADRPGASIADTALDEIGTASGRFRLVVKVRTWRIFEASALDNAGSVAVGPWQGSASLAFNSILVPGDSLSLAGSAIPGGWSELGYGRLSYDAPVGADGLRLGMDAFHSEARPGDGRRFTRTFSRTDNLAAKLSFAPLLSQTHSLWVTGSLGVSEVSEGDRLGPSYKSRFPLATLSADYKLHAAEGSWTYVSAGLRAGLGPSEVVQSPDAWALRGGVNESFAVFSGALTHYHNLTDSWSVKAALGGQVATAPLVSSQQYYLGGLSFGRGFEGGWLAGDNALAGSAELRYDQRLNLAFAKSLQFYGFVEGGLTQSYGQPKDLVQELVSAGIGARLFVNDDLQLGVALAKPLAYRSPLRRDPGTLVLFSISHAFRLCPERSDWRCQS